MQAPSPEFWLNALFYGLAVGSLAVWLPIAVRWNNDGCVLPYEPRRSVPWNFLGAVPAVLYVVLAFARVIGSGEEATEVDLDFVLWETIISTIVLIGLVVAIALAIVHLRDGTTVDLGLPRDAAQFCRDAGLGTLAWLAALPPVYAVQWMLFELFGEPSQNPLVKQVQEHLDGRMIAAAIVSAVIAAPIFEEFLYRLLLQGWLERVEDRAIGFRTTERTQTAAPTESDYETEVNQIAPDDLPATQLELPRRGVFPGIGHGFIPIVLSSLLFALAHIGYGPDPVALFVLALFLGYLYQRTHRIVPCIVVHMLFNAANLLMLWLALQGKRP